MNVKISVHAKKRLKQRFGIKTKMDGIKIENLQHLHNDKYVFDDTILIIKNNTLITIYTRK